MEKVFLLVHRVMSVLRRFLRSKRAEQELDDDIQGFLDASSAEKIREGIPPAEARRLAEEAAANPAAPEGEAHETT